MKMKLSQQLEHLRASVESEIQEYIEANNFYLEMHRKDYAANEQGQALLKLTSLAINISYEIDALKKHNL